MSPSMADSQIYLADRSVVGIEISPSEKVWEKGLKDYPTAYRRWDQPQVVAQCLSRKFSDCETKDQTLSVHSHLDGLCGVHVSFEDRLRVQCSEQSQATNTYTVLVRSYYFWIVGWTTQDTNGFDHLTRKIMSENTANHLTPSYSFMYANQFLMTENN